MNVDALEDLVEQAVRDLAVSGVVRVDFDGDVVFEGAYGLADRAHGIPNRPDTQFAIASGAKGFTALTIMSMVGDGLLRLDTPVRSVLGRDLPLVDDDVTVEHLLTHRSGIGDYLDEDEDHDYDDYLMPVSVHRLASTEQYLAVLEGHPMKFAPGSRFSYSNGGYVVLALIAERVSGVAFHELVVQRVCAPAGMNSTAFLRSDELPGRAAIGYLSGEDPRTNVFHLPVRGSGDGGIFTTVGDVHLLWDAFFDGRIVSTRRVAGMTTPHDGAPDEQLRYGVGFWLDEANDTVSLHGFDAGVTFVSVRDRANRFTSTVVTNTSRGGWPLSQRILEVLTAGLGGRGGRAD